MSNEKQASETTDAPKVVIPDGHPTLPIGDLRPYPKNTRIHSPAQIANIASSIREFGFLVPVLVDAENEIIAGHGRVEAARAIGLDEIPILRTDHLTPAQIKAYRIADNAIAERSTWDDVFLSQEMIELDGLGFDLNVIGFDTKTLDDILGNVSFNPDNGSGQARLDARNDCECPKCGHRFVPK